jgi:hypothetical protein
VFARFLLWRLFGLVAVVFGLSVSTWMLHGGLGSTLRDLGSRNVAVPQQPNLKLPHTPRLHLPTIRAPNAPSPSGVLSASTEGLHLMWTAVPLAGVPLAQLLVWVLITFAAALAVVRLIARNRRRYVRLRVSPYRTDRATVEGIVSMFEALHKRLLRRWWRRLFLGQPSLSLEVHLIPRIDTGNVHRHSSGEIQNLGGGAYYALLAISCPVGLEEMVGAALRTAYPNSKVQPIKMPLGRPPSLLRLKKHTEFIKRVKMLDRYEHEREPPMNRLLTVMGACGSPAYVQLALTPAPMNFERHAKRAYKHHERHVTRQREGERRSHPRSIFEDSELVGALDVQHRPLFFVDLRVIAPSRRITERVASELRAEGAENRLIERNTVIRQGVFGLYDRRVDRGEGNPIPSLHKGVFASTELAALWHLPSIDYTTVPFTRAQMPIAPAPPAIYRPPTGPGTLMDALGPVSIHPELRRQNTAVPGTVEQGKSSYLVASVAEDLRREHCAVIVLDPKGDAADAAVSVVPKDRTCTLLDFSHPTCGFNPLAADVPADVIADYVVGALKNLFTDADIRASSDRYLRNAIIAALAHDTRSTLWDAARLLSVGEEGYAYRARVGASVRGIPEFKEISEFFTAELSAQLADARSTTTSKLDAPVNKLARLLNSPSIKRILLNDSLRVDFDQVIRGREVLIVKGAMGAMGAGNTSVLMQMLVGMLDASLARQQDYVNDQDRVAVALKIDEAPLVLNRGFAETMALKRSAGLETVACWQADSQWTEREIRDQLDAMFAHRVYFATASTRDAREAASLMMAEFSDMVRPDLRNISALGHPDARLHLPKHHAIVSWTTEQGRQGPFVAQTIPLKVDRERISYHTERQQNRGGRYRDDLRQPHWDRAGDPAHAAPGHRQPASSLGSPDRTRPVPVSLGKPDAIVRERALGIPQERPAPTPSTTTTQLADTAAQSAHDPEVSQPQGYVEDQSPDESSPPDTGSQQAQRPAQTAETQSPVSRSAKTQPATSDPATSDPATNGHDPQAAASPFSAFEKDQAEPAASTPSATYRELADLDGAHRLRWAKQAESLRVLKPDPLDMEIMVLLARLRHVLSSQIHQRFNIGRATTTTQRRLKRLSEAGLVHRFQFHRRDGGGIPMCYVITQSGLDLLYSRERLERSIEGQVGGGGEKSPLTADDEQLLRQARHDIHVSGWVLALERATGGPPYPIRGPHESVLSPPMRSTPGGRVAFGPEDLRLPGGRAPHDFWRTGKDAQRTPVARFETVRPDATIEVPIPGSESTEGRAVRTDVIVELDDRLPTGAKASKLERYDHLITGWAMQYTRYGRRLGREPTVVFVCRDRSRARECARRADQVLLACRAYAGEYPSEWEYAGRERIVFAAERDVHEGSLCAYGVPRLPPDVRVSDAGDDPAARAMEPVQRELLD